MDISDARHNINTLVIACGSAGPYNDECKDLMIQSWRMIQAELNWQIHQHNQAHTLMAKIDDIEIICGKARKFFGDTNKEAFAHREATKNKGDGLKL